MAGALDGVKVLDLTTIYSGPICTTILGDQGADIIKIESPGGDFMRQALDVERNGVSGMFSMLNRNKRSIVIDLSTDEGKSLLKEMLASADVVVENFRPGVMDRLGFDYETMKSINPRIIYASINGVGQNGPYAKRRVYDAIIQAISGVATLQSDPAQERPIMVNTLICDKLTSLVSAQAISSALYSRSQTGQGQRIDVAMLDAALFFLWPDNMRHYAFVGDEVPPETPHTHANMVRKTKDGYVCTMPVQPDEWMGLFRALELPNLLEDPGYYIDGAVNAEKLTGTLNEAFETFTTEQMLLSLEREDVPYSKINSRDEVIDDPQVKAMESIWEFDHPFAGPMRQARPPARFSETPSEIFHCSPELGQHTREILSEFGLSKERARELIDKKIAQ